MEYNKVASEIYYIGSMLCFYAFAPNSFVHVTDPQERKRNATSVTSVDNRH